MAVQTAEIAKKEQSPIKIKLEDGTVVDGNAWKTLPIDIAKGVSKDCAKDSIVARVIYTDPNVGKALDDASGVTDEVDEEEDQGVLWDLLRPLEGDCTIFFYTFEDSEAKMVFWHSSAHILGQCLEQEVGSQLTVGPPVELSPKGSFFYDSYMGSETISEADYKVLEKKAATVIKAKQKFERLVLTKPEALELFSDNPFKVATISSKVPDGGMTSAYRNGPLIDLCLGPHITDTSRIKAFAVKSHSSAYYGGDENNDSLQRVYGVAFPEKSAMKEYEAQMKLLLEYDHRKVGLAQELFFFHELSPGSAMFLPHGAMIYNTLCDFIREEYWKRNYTEAHSNLYPYITLYNPI